MGDNSKELSRPRQYDRRQLEERFEVQEAEVRLQNYRRGALLAAIFVMGGTVLDVYQYNDKAPQFLLLRVACTVFLVGVLILLHLPPVRRFARLLGHLVAFVPMVTLDFILLTLRDAGSPYYAALNLIMVGSVLLLRWKFSDGVINASLCLGGYLVVAMQVGTEKVPIPVTFFFLFVTAVFACVGLYYYNRLRFAEFCLREEVIEQQEDLARNYRKLQELEEAKTRFFANISHELRTPLTLILAPVEKLRAANAVRNDPALTEMIDSLEDNGRRLLRLINDLLDLVRLDSGEMPLRPEQFKPAAFIEGLGRNLKPIAERKGIQFSWSTNVPEDQTVYLDRDRLEKIVLNLGVNALKFTPPGGVVKLCACIEGHTMELVVQDNGAGMSKEQMDHAFERFWQADTSIRRKFRGVGIGLALVKSFTESLDGEVKVESEPNEGTTFRITIPIPAFSRPSGADEEAESGAGPDAFEQIHERARLHVVDTDLAPANKGRRASVFAADGRPQVLIADDEEGLRRFLRGELEEIGCDVIEARDGAEALEYAQQYLPDLIVLDFMMPEIDGIELTRTLRKDDLTSQLPIALITAHADDTPRIEALKAGVTDFLTKPFTTAELKVRINNLLDRQKYQRELGLKNRELNRALEEIKENEARLLHAEKLSSLGRMSAGIVHEVNNPLNYSKTAIHALKMYADDLPGAEQEEFLETVGDLEEGVDRVITIVSDLRRFTKGESVMREPVEIGKVIESARRLLSHELQGIDFVVTVPEKCAVIGNENQLTQVFVNLVQNAAQSLEEKGAPAGEALIEIVAEPTPSGNVLIILRDNGCGIDPQDIEHIFDPFFTKREVGEGMGLGLSICHRIIESHDGRIDVDSVPHDFTEFTITLPGPRDDPPHRPQERDQGVEPRSTTGTITIHQATSAL